MQRVGWVRRAGLVLDLVGFVALAFGLGGIVAAVWLAVYWEIQGLPPLERLPDPYAALVSQWIDRGLFVVVLVWGLVGLRRRYRAASNSRAAQPRRGLRHTWFGRFLVFLGQVVLALVIALAVAEWAGRLYVRWYANDIGVPLHELSEDYGMGLMAGFISFTSMLIVLPLALCRLRALSRNHQPHKESPAPVAKT